METSLVDDDAIFIDKYGQELFFDFCNRINELEEENERLSGIIRMRNRLDKVLPEEEQEYINKAMDEFNGSASIDEGIIRNG